MKVSDLESNQLPYALMLAMKRKNLPEINWELCGTLLEKEKISVIRSYSRWNAFYVGPRSDSKEAEQFADTAIEAIVKCYIEKKLGSEINML
ncbi:phage protein NinX family protein [Acinetobacter ursingii]|uniref:phage protein NinX family protein n=1 Tax=Acinetobacter ursingii TaxID=108980 RepID=UPI0012507459|nr:phage protein NinX family protein [Acinetobacter ursingii]